ncbi:MAG: metallophosphoesterase family protein [Candidatus Hermodarchaeota archaeon]
MKKKIAIYGDIHGNLEAFKAVLSKLKGEKIDYTLITGDIVGYYPHPTECIDLIRNLKTYTAISGNHDRTVTLKKADWNKRIHWFNDVAQEALTHCRTKLHLPKNKEYLEWLSVLPVKKTLELEGWKIYLCHGSPNDLDEYVYKSEAKERSKKWFEKFGDIILLGHTHLPFSIRTKQGNLVINPGSVGQPRDGDNRAAYSILTLNPSGKPQIKNYRVKYNIEKTNSYVKAERLPLSLGTRLYKGL